jgi:hypothetical protein
VKREAYLLSKIVGHLAPQKEELWESASAIISGRDWDVGRARIFVCWISGGSEGGQIEEQGHKFCVLEEPLLKPVCYQSLARFSIRY